MAKIVGHVDLVEDKDGRFCTKEQWIALEEAEYRVSQQRRAIAREKRAERASKPVTAKMFDYTNQDVAKILYGG